jgi:hypothetical protein
MRLVLYGLMDVRMCFDDYYIKTGSILKLIELDDQKSFISQKIPGANNIRPE